MSKLKLILHVFEKQDDAKAAFFKFVPSFGAIKSLTFSTNSALLTVETPIEFHMFKQVRCQHDADALKGCELSEIRGLERIQVRYHAQLRTQLRKST